MGSGFRTFTAGEVLTASNVQNYLMDQSVMVFGGSAARSSAIGTANFEEGMISYLTDTDKVEAYNGTNWVSVAPASTQGLTLINTTSFSGVASFNLPANTFSSTYTNYKILVRFTAATSDATVLMRMRAGGTTSTTANWSFGTYGFASSNAAYSYGNSSDTIYYLGQTEGTNPDNFRHFMDITLSEPFVANYTSVIHTLAGSSNAATYTGQSGGGFHSIKTSYDSVTIGVDAGAVTGFYSVYGYNV